MCGGSLGCFSAPPSRLDLIFCEERSKHESQDHRREGKLLTESHLHCDSVVCSLSCHYCSSPFLQEDDRLFEKRAAAPKKGQGRAKGKGARGGTDDEDDDDGDYGLAIKGPQSGRWSLTCSAARERVV